ncbi:MFS transporter [Neobacillus rhizophilus]|uniref:MFS transporter n=1 Tax=Neobacillus rhizophilus TaxID=2833579 RepID=A0A942UAQ4_9BACI|nr:MFS transporter [Neobacillus rhizophilus]MBS4214669.1 MFS transporter [Neobacillus rhizophilus]
MSSQPQIQAPTMKSLFANRFVQSILLSGLFLQLGIWVRNFAILMFVTEQTNKDPFAISMISVAEFGPIFLFSFIGGTFADRWRPKRTMVLCDLLSALSIFAVLLALVFGGWKAIFFATLVSSVLSQFSQPSGMKLFKLHVPQVLMQLGMSMNQTLQSIFTVLGPIIGTLIYFQFGIYVSIAIMGICFLLSALVLAFLPADQKVETVLTTNVSAEMKMGLRYVFSNKLFLYMGGFFLAAGMGLGLVNPLGIFLVTENLGLSAHNLQWFTALNGAGMILGGVGAMALSKKITPQKMLLIGFISSAVSVAVLGSVNLVWAALLAQFVFGIMGPPIHIACNTLILTNAEESFVGRVNGILNPLFMGGMVLNMSLVGLLKAEYPLIVMYLMASSLFLIGALTLLPMLKLKSAKQVKAIPMQHH